MPLEILLIVLVIIVVVLIVVVVQMVVIFNVKMPINTIENIIFCIILLSFNC